VSVAVKSSVERSRWWLIAALIAASMAAPSVANAEDVWRRLSLRLEGGVGYMLGDYQQRVLTQGLALHGAARAGFVLVGPVALQVGFDSVLFPNERGGGQSWLVGGGLRAEPSVGRIGRVTVDANAGAALTGPYLRFGYNAGAGFEFNATSFLAVGPSVRFHHVVATDGDVSGSALFLSGGAMLTLHGPPEVARAARDSDSDGVIDGDDLCVDVAAGSRPDPARAGCPLTDRDSDGVSDREDLCPDTAAGAQPDHARPGCPAGDADGDGVTDAEDVCPTNAQGANADPSRRGCPDGDDDNDRVRNSVDQCRAQHHGMHPDPSRAGCPAPDGDNDNVPDRVDACPSEPGQPHPNRARNGCPGMVRVEDGQIRTLEPVFFDTNSDRIQPRSERLLQSLADALQASPEIQRLGVHGHTDDVGEDGQNLELSTRRAASVLQWLVRHNVAADRLESRGFGETRPLVPGQSEQARAVNRRVEFRILQSTASGAAASTM
jgi:outer membrane protein OmpA-like peptidoglycan-associated protein